MKRQALKFYDLGNFFSVMSELGLGQQAYNLLYERNKLPYCSAYLIPTEILPSTFVLNQCSRFGGVLTQVKEINYLGTEQFYSDFMIYPLSMAGYIEVGDVSPITFAADVADQERDNAPMIYVINLEDGGGQEFYLTTGGKLIALSAVTSEEPQTFKTYKLAAKKIEQVRDKYPAICRLYAIEQGEFGQRQRTLQPKTESTDTPPT